MWEVILKTFLFLFLEFVSMLSYMVKGIFRYDLFKGLRRGDDLG